ncbi:MAG: hypothetical protein J1D87_04315 [Lachnospiraceae bacterium]|nr:hypothetical protein [Lachnospiraceae bacterium]
MGIIGRILKKIKEVGVKNCVRGAILRLKYIKLQKKYGFDTWHLSPYEWRAYSQKTALYINSHGAKKVIDIGCGLGGLLSHINADSKIGLDIHEEVILAAKELGDKSIAYRVGSFNEVINEKNIDYLVTLGFTHGGTEETWKEPYHIIAEKNDIRNFVVDTVPEDGPSHFLDYSKILPENYVMVDRLGPFLGGRCVEIWERQHNA